MPLPTTLALPAYVPDIHLLDNGIVAKRQALKETIALQKSAAERVKSQQDDIRSMIDLKAKIRSTMDKEWNIHAKVRYATVSLT